MFYEMHSFLGLMLSILILRQLSVHGETDTDIGLEPRRQILVLGGNGFMGSSTVSRLIDLKDDIFIVNRGNWYWDSGSRILPHVKHVYCDRHEKIADKCPELTEFIKDRKFDFVIDFSSYTGQQALEMVDILQGKVGLYILISTDSVYDVCDKKHDSPSKESDSVRPEKSEEIDWLASLHRYGHNKLAAEEAVVEKRLSGGSPFVILRLPDVIGPRDTTYRWWIYQLWIKLSPLFEDHPVTVPQFLVDFPMSFVYSEDVADLIVHLFKLGPQVRDQIVNVAWPETITLKQFYEDVQEALGIEQGGFDEIPDEKAFYLYPSVRKGPVDVTKAQNLLNWEPTEWKKAVTDTVQFYEDVFTNPEYEHQRNEIIQVVASELFTDHQTAFYEGLEKAYNVELTHFKNKKDEL